MLELQQLLPFVGTAIILILAPGPDIIFTVSQGITNGRLAGFTTAAGLALGNLFHTTLVALGVATLLKQSVLAFTILKIAGCCYLLYIAFKLWKHAAEGLALNNGELKSQNLFFRGLVMNILNPKVALFFLALFPQFINAETSSPYIQIFSLGIIFIIMTLIIFGLLGTFAGYVGELIQQHPRIVFFVNRFCAIVILLLAIKVVTAVQ